MTFTFKYFTFRNGNESTNVQAINISLAREGGEKEKNNSKASRLHGSTMISAPAVVCLLSKWVLKPPSSSYHTWQFVLCLYAGIQWVSFSMTARRLRKQGAEGGSGWMGEGGERLPFFNHTHWLSTWVQMFYEGPDFICSHVRLFITGWFLFRSNESRFPDIKIIDSWIVCRSPSLSWTLANRHKYIYWL